MKHLYLMRHASASHGFADFDRPLNLEGRKQLEVLCAKNVGFFDGVGAVLCSTSTRTRQTCAGIADLFLPSTAYHFLDSLYHASAETVLEEIRLLPDTTQSVFIIAHNPGVSEFLGLSSVPVSMTMGTAQIACFGTTIESWSQLNFKDCVFQEIR